jgi:HK97 family phage prohead protease
MTIIPELKTRGEDREIRSLPMSEMRVEAREGQAPVIAGYAAVFDQPSEVMLSFREIIRPGAFARSLAGRDVRALWNHDTAQPLGRTKNGTLQLAEDARGLKITITPPDTAWGRDALESIRRGDVDQMSFGFTALKENWTEDGVGFPLRELLEVKLWEVSPVTFPAYPDTTVAVRNMEAAGLGRQSAQEDEAALPEPWRKAYREREIQIGGAI